MDRVLIVGGAGYIGGQIAKDNPEWDVYDSLIYEKYFYLPNKFILGDIRDTKKLSKILPNYDTVIWLAAIVGDGACLLNPVLTKDVNEYATKWLVKNYDGRIIFPSSCSVYGSSEGLLTEESKLNPLSLYALTKINSEKILMEHNNVLIFRLGTIFGCSIRPRFDLVVNTLTAHAYINKKIKVFGGDQWRPNIHVKDVAKLIGDVSVRSETGIYNLANENMKIIDIAHIVKRNISSTKLIVTESPFEDNRNYKADCSKLKNTFDFVPEYSIDMGVKEMLNFLKSGRVKNPFDSNFHNARYMHEYFEKNGEE